MPKMPTEIPSPPLWQRSFTKAAAGITPVPAADTGEPNDIVTQIGSQALQ